MNVLQESEKFLAGRKIENARLNAERLIGKALNYSRVELYLQFDKPLSQEERQICRDLVLRRGGQEPLQYILGETEFMSLPFLVQPGVLIPRPETELLVENCLQGLEGRAKPRILDIGTGSGCIAVSLAHYLPDAEIVAVDVSATALSIAAENARLNKVESSIEFIETDILKSLSALEGMIFDVVVSNPPYIALDEWSGLPEEIAEWEPRQALCDEGDGYLFYKIISERIYDFISENGLLIVETGHTQANLVKEIFAAAGFKDGSINKDLAGIPRIVISRK